MKLSHLSDARVKRSPGHYSPLLVPKPSRWALLHPTTSALLMQALGTEGSTVCVLEGQR